MWGGQLTFCQRDPSLYHAGLRVMGVRHILLAVLLLPVAQAVTWEDPAGDHEVGAAEIYTTAPAGWYPNADVLRLEINEVNADEVRIEVELASLEPGSEPQEPNRVSFGMRLVDDPLNRTWLLEDTGDSWWVWFMRDVFFDTPDGPERFFARMAGGPADVEGNVVSGTMPKSTFASDELGASLLATAPPRAGAVFELEPFAANRDRSTALNRPTVRDHLGPAQEFEFLIEDERRGDVTLFVESPWRGSNGAATTYLFDVSAHNEGTGDRTSQITVSAPASWVVRAPFDVGIPAGETIVFPVAITVPFQHQHGTFEAATILATADDGTEAQTEVYVIWHDPPQPGGHHPRVTLKAPFGYPSFDAGPAPDGGSIEAWDRQFSGLGPVRDATSTWYFFLNPSRSVGLDFNADGAVQGEVTFEVTEASDVVLTARLMLSGDDTVLAQQRQEASWEAGQHAVRWDMPVAAGIDQFAPDEGGNLVFEFTLEHKITDPTLGTYGSGDPRASIHFADNWFNLPLSDYHEQIDLNAVGVARLSLHTPEPARLVNPDEVAVIPFVVANHASSERRLEWTLESSADWIRIEKPPSRLGPGKNASFSVVASPGDLPDGTVAQVLVIAKDVETGIESCGRVAVTVTTGQEILDERLLAPDTDGPSQESPLPVVMLVAALWLVARATKR